MLANRTQEFSKEEITRRAEGDLNFIPPKSVTRANARLTVHRAEQRFLPEFPIGVIRSFDRHHVRIIPSSAGSRDLNCGTRATILAAHVFTAEEFRGSSRRINSIVIALCLRPRRKIAAGSRKFGLPNCRE